MSGHSTCRRALLGLSGLLLGARSEELAGDAAALVQTGLRSHSGAEQEGLLQGRAHMLAEMSRGDGSAAAFDCEKYPAFCREPFNCQVPRKPELPHAKNDHANLETWCTSPAYYPYVKACVVDKDLKKAAQVQYQWSVDNRGPHGGVDELDGSYCFIEGHCSNEAVTENTTMAEAEKMCDFRYGHNGWAHWDMRMEPRAIASGLLMGSVVASNTTGFHDSKLTRVFLKLACAMGNYHCDVVYCKETYCKKDYYIKKYQHLMPKTPGHLLKQRFGPL